MAKTKTTLRFWLRTDRLNKDGTAPIHLIYQISGQRKYYGVPDIKLLPVNWDPVSQVAIFLDKKKVSSIAPGSDPALLLTATEVSEINSDLYKLQVKVQSLENDFEAKGITFSAQMIVDKLKEGSRRQTKIDSHSSALFDFIEKYIEDHKTTREPGSLSVYRALKRHLEEYQKQTGRKVTFENIDYSFFQSFQGFLIEKRNLNNTTVAKQLSTIKTFLNYAKVQGVEISDRYKNFKIKRESLEVVALTNDEFETLFNMDLTGNNRLDKVRDIFCFACATGLRFSDIEQLKREHIKGDEIRITVKKTKEQLTIPLNPYSMAILTKYKDMKDPLPMMSNQKLNQYLKGWTETAANGEPGRKHEGLCELAGINDPIEIVRFRGAKREATIYPKFELIGMHTGRKTFATLSLEKGMSAEEVMTITGHKDYKSFKRYVKITEARKKTVMRKAWGEIKPAVLKAI